MSPAWSARRREPSATTRRSGCSRRPPHARPAGTGSTRRRKPSPEGVPGAVRDPQSLRAEELTFAGAGGTSVNGYLSRGAAGGRRPGMIVIHEAGGLGEHIRDVCNRFAALGYVTLGVDLYTR